MKCHFFSLSDTGRVRTNNEDALAVDAELGLVVLADGMGGYEAGEVASAIATQVLHDELRPRLRTGSAKPRDIKRWLQQGADHANRAIYEASLKELDYRGMGTTLVAAVFRNARLTVGHVGDSRLYRLRQGQLATLTRDHSLIQEQIDAGLLDPTVAHTVQHRNLITRALGVTPYVDLEVGEHTIESGDTYLLCSDGLNDMLPDAHIANILRSQPALEGAALALLAAANEAGGHDNISLVLVQCSPQPTARRRLAWLLTP